MRELETAEHELRRSRRDRAEARPRAGMGAERLEILADRPEPSRTHVERLSRHRRVERAHDRVDEVLDRKQLVTVASVAQDRNAPALADPVEQDLEHPEPLGADEGLRTDGHDLQ